MDTRTPRTDSEPLPTDSMVTVSLSDPESIPQTTKPLEETTEETIPGDTMEEAVPEIECVENTTDKAAIIVPEEVTNEEVTAPSDDPTEPIVLPSEDFYEEGQLIEWEDQPSSDNSPAGSIRSRRSSNRSSGSEDEARVDWEELEKTEEQEQRDEASDEVRTRFILTASIADGESPLLFCWPGLNKRTTRWC